MVQAGLSSLMEKEWASVFLSLWYLTLIIVSYLHVCVINALLSLPSKLGQICALHSCQLDLSLSSAQVAGGRVPSLCLRLNLFEDASKRKKKLQKVLCEG